MMIRRVNTIGNHRQAASQLKANQTPVVTARPVDEPDDNRRARRLKDCASSISNASTMMVREVSLEDS
jgi:hypothetical protein